MKERRVGPRGSEPEGGARDRTSAGDWGGPREADTWVGKRMGDQGFRSPCGEEGNLWSAKTVKGEAHK